MKTDTALDTEQGYFILYINRFLPAFVFPPDADACWEQVSSCAMLSFIICVIISDKINTLLSFLNILSSVRPLLPLCDLSPQLSGVCVRAHVDSAYIDICCRYVD